MSLGKMHANEVSTDALLVKRLLEAQFPHWANLRIEPADSGGTDNYIYRLGDELAVRLPRIPSAQAQVAKEQHWLPRLAPLLPLPIPVPLGMGRPAEGYPWSWSVCLWLPGANATREHVADPREAATALARFVDTLQRIDPAGGPVPGPHNSFRGEPLRERDRETRAAIATVHGTVDVGDATEAWNAALRAPAWEGASVWIHGDLHSGNLLAAHGRLSAVIDFGCLGVGDPACDLMAAWTFLSAESREAFRAASPVDEATWARARGWALSFGLIALPYYERTNPALARIARHSIREAVADHKAALPKGVRRVG